jgi:hypothetical protein
MPQLVGSICVLCNKRIGSILEGHFCRACARPIHAACMLQEKPEEAPGRCTLCGSEGVTTPVLSVSEGIPKDSSKPPSFVQLFGLLFRGGHIVQFSIVGVFTLALGLYLLLDPNLRGGWRLVDVWPGLVTLLASAISFGAALFLLLRLTKK